MSIDIRTSEGQPFILLPTFINSRGPFSFVLDTGAALSIVPEELAAGLAIRNIERKEALGAGGKRISISVGEATSMSVGGAEVQNARIGILETLPRCVGQGVIGYDFLRHYVVTIDYRNHTLSLEAPAEHAVDDQSARASMPLELARPDRPVILVRVVLNGDRTGQFILDTGASQSVISPDLAGRLGMKNMHTDTIIGAGGAVPSRAAALKSLRIGNSLLDEVAVIVADIFSPLNEAVGARIDGIIGYNVLAKFRLIIDYPGGRLRLCSQ